MCEVFIITYPSYPTALRYGDMVLSPMLFLPPYHIAPSKALPIALGLENIQSIPIRNTRSMVLARRRTAMFLNGFNDYGFLTPLPKTTRRGRDGEGIGIGKGWGRGKKTMTLALFGIVFPTALTVTG